MTDFNHSERLQRIKRLVFKQRNLIELQEAVTDLLKIFYDVLEKENENGSFFSYKEMKQRLRDIEDKKWSEIRSKYLTDEFHGYSQGNFSSKEMESPAKILLDFLAMMDQCKQAVLSKIEEKHHDVMVMENKTAQMEEFMARVQDERLLERQQHKDKLVGYAGLEDKVRRLTELLEEKNRRIFELQRADNVQLWEKEKERILAESNKRIKELENEVMDLRDGKDRYLKKMNDQKNSEKLQKIALQRRSTVPSHINEENNAGVSEEAEKLKRTHFIMEKDIAHLENELYTMQKHTVGVMGGLKTDIHILGHKYIDLDSGHVDQEYEDLTRRVEKIYNSVAEGDLRKARATLPPHYTFYNENDVKLKRVRRLSQPVLQVPRSLTNNKQNIQKKESGDASLLLAVEEYHNPVIVKTDTKQIHTINHLKHFPHMSTQFIKDQYERFCSYDKNGDHSLDLSEVIKVMSSLGFDFNAHQLREAMEEVDRDSNHTLDFYEYLLILDNIYRRTGKAELFQEGLNQIKKKNLSSVCSVQ